MVQRSGVRFGGAAATALMVAGAVTSNQVFNNGVWNLPWLVAALAAAALTVYLDRRHNPTPAAPMLYPSIAGPGGLPLLLADATVTELGVHDNRFTPAPYVLRSEAHAELISTLSSGELASGRVVIVEGSRLAGTTRTLVEAAKNVLSDHRVAWFLDDPRVSLADMIAQAGRWARRELEDYDSPAAGVVVWLERLPESRLRELVRFLTSYTSAPISGAGLPGGVWLLATLDSGELVELRDRDQIEQTLDATAVRVQVGSLTEDERAALAALDAYAALRSTLEQEADVFIGRLMVAWTALRQALAPGQTQDSTDRVALLHAVTDWERVPMPRPLTDDILTPLFAAYRNTLTTTHPRDPTAGLPGALTWATAQSAGKDGPALITAIATGRRRGEHHYLPHPLLSVLADDTTETLAWPISTALWVYADCFCTPDQRHAIAVTALRRNAYDAAARLLDHPGTPADIPAYFSLAHHYLDHRDVTRARHWSQRIVSTNHPDEAPRAMFILGALEFDQGQMDKARDWIGKIIESGHHDHAPTAMVILGAQESEQGRVEQARDWYGKAIESGHHARAPQAMVNLGALELKQGRVEQARDWFGKAIESGHRDHAPQAMNNLGVLETSQGRVEQARDWLGKAVESGHHDQAPTAMLNLALLENEHGRVEQERDWFGKVVESGHHDHAPKAMNNLAVLEIRQGRVEQARDWFGKAIESGHNDEAPNAMNNLGLLETDQGRLEQARDWFGKAIESGHNDHAPRGMVNLGDLEAVDGRMEEARDWYREAIESGHHDHAPSAMYNLGALEIRQGRLEQARDWFGKAIGSGQPHHAPLAMVGLGVLELRLGRVEQARSWFEKAKQSDDLDAETAARHAIEDLDRRAEEQRRAEHFGKYGWQAYADHGLMARPDRHDQPNTQPNPPQDTDEDRST